MSNVNCYFHSEIQTMIDMQRFKKLYQKWNPRTKIENGLTIAMYSKSLKDKWSHDTCQIDSLFELMDIKSAGHQSINGISPCSLETPVVSYSCSPPPCRGRLVEPVIHQDDRSGKKFKKLWHIFRKTKGYCQPQEQLGDVGAIEPQIISGYKGSSGVQDTLHQSPARMMTHHSLQKTHRYHRSSHYKNKLKGDANNSSTY
ncbi:uncharacterized protein Ecym_3587 [Eremothecium cymbalariae DBVPG|uniref:Uncharacterized protein n=1 Tax=Eremothecium cymbalariae (strain CBS 270.75 / DBVPG 7215 / KCTC 17166 / NRRL Y-17582) TaxID=931890 RepID=G8JQS0_ERECY|nr:Hypothetical protein Ecym_3587 [Eremothecium cymbalariae DBVPG\